MPNAPTAGAVSVDAGFAQVSTATRPFHEDRFIGPPGTGKTTALSGAIRYYAGLHGIENVVAVSHTRAAAAELANHKDEHGRTTPLPAENIGTLHSFAYRAIGHMPLAEDPKTLPGFQEAHPEFPMACEGDPDDFEFRVNPEGGAALADYSRLRNLEEPRESYLWSTETLRFATVWEDYKKQTGSIDFADMIEIAANDTTSATQNPAIMVLDECQDTSKLQWRLVNRWASAPGCERIITAGDPDQAIFVWGGADPTYLRDNQPDREKILSQSFRVPRAPHALAMQWIRSVTNRADVNYLPRDADGRVLRTKAMHTSVEPLLPLIEKRLGEGKTVMIQTACGYMLKDALTVLRREGIPFSNPWRTKQAAWNPLNLDREGSTCGSIADFLALHTYGRDWTKDEALSWLHITKGLLRRGGKSDFVARVKECDNVMSLLASEFINEEDLVDAIGDLPGCIDWLEQHLLAARKPASAFPLSIARLHGAKAISEKPRLYIGTCHSFKGSEADTVIVFPDLSRQGYMQWRGGGQDELRRLFYVAMTRTREELVLGSPSGNMAVWA